MASSYIGSSLLSQKISDIETALTATNTKIEVNKMNVTELQAWANDRVKYAYPNGGSEGDEKTLSLSGIYHETSPFGPGVKFNAITEYFSVVKGEWIELQKSFYAQSDGSYGTLAYSRSEIGALVVATGSRSMAYTGSPTYGAGWGQDDATNLKWRVRCVRED